MVYKVHSEVSRPGSRTSPKEKVDSVPLSRWVGGGRGSLDMPTESRLTLAVIDFESWTTEVSSPT